MAEIDQEKIRALAYELWERDGAPEGKDEDYWHAAEKLLADESDRDAVEPEVIAPGLPPLTPPV